MKSFFRVVCACLVLFISGPLFASAKNNPKVIIQTNLGNITVELYPADAPITVDNFLRYVNEGFYDGLLFHRVIKNFMIQAGGYYLNGMTIYPIQPNFPPIINESYNGLSNLRGTIAMARTSVPNSATSEFFINHVDNLFLDKKNASDGVGYCVFGKVTKGLNAVDAIANSPTYIVGSLTNFPIPVVEISAAYCLPSSSYSKDLNSDGCINFKDFALLAQNWHRTDSNSKNNFCGGTDLDYSGSVNSLDLALLADNWLGPLGFEPQFSDLNADNSVNSKDASILTSHWLDTGCSAANNFCSGSDINHDGITNFRDFALLAKNWHASISP